MNSETGQSKPGLLPHCLWGHSHTPSLHILSCVCFSTTSFHLCAPAKHHSTKLTFQRNQKFPLHMCVIFCTLVPHYACWDQRTTWRTWLSPSALWFLGLRMCIKPLAWAALLPLLYCFDIVRPSLQSYKNFKSDKMQVLRLKLDQWLVLWPMTECLLIIHVVAYNTTLIQTNIRQP